MPRSQTTVSRDVAKKHTGATRKQSLKVAESSDSAPLLRARHVSYFHWGVVLYTVNKGESP